MRSFLRNTLLFVAAACMATPRAMADGRHNGASGSNRQERSHQSGNRGTSGRPGLGSSRPAGNHGNTRPGSNNNNNGNGHRPGSGNNSGRPGLGNNNNNPNNNNPGNRPVGNNNSNNHRPGNQPGNNPGNRPGTSPGNHRPGTVNPGHPGFTGSRPPAINPPHRPYRPTFGRPVHRPTPPPAWRPSRGLPVIRGILGLTFGSALGVSLDFLYNNGYVVDGYSNDVVYLRNVPALNYIWTDGALYYGARGLDVSSFYYSTPGYDLSRYNSCYGTLSATYGPPVAINNGGGAMSATWFGGNNGYVTLSFGAGTAGRFLTTLTFGL